MIGCPTSRSKNVRDQWITVFVRVPSKKGDVARHGDQLPGRRHGQGDRRRLRTTLTEGEKNQTFTCIEHLVPSVRNSPNATVSFKSRFQLCLRHVPEKQTLHL